MFYAIGNISENITDTFEALRKKLAPRVYKGFKSAIVRSSFFIGLTNPGTGTDSTKYRVRWMFYAILCSQTVGRDCNGNIFSQKYP